MATDAEKTWGNLARLGFSDTEHAEKLFAELGEVTRPLAPLLGRSADPDMALNALVALAAAVEDRDVLLQEVADDEGTSMRLLSVLGASQALGDHLRKHPEHWHELTDPTLGSTRPAAYAIRDGLLGAVGADPRPAEPLADGAGRFEADSHPLRRRARRIGLHHDAAARREQLRGPGQQRGRCSADADVPVQQQDGPPAAG